MLLDFVADKRLRIPREAGSDPALWARLRAAAQAGRRGLDVPAAHAGGDHRRPHAVRRGRACPAIDLIDFDFPCWHKRCDDMSAVSAESLDRSGEAVLELLRTWR